MRVRIDAKDTAIIERLLVPAPVEVEPPWMRIDAEETGHTARGKSLPLGAAKQPGGKIVHAWAVEDDWDTALLG